MSLAALGAKPTGSWLRPLPCISTMFISWPTSNLGAGHHRHLHRRPFRPCTVCITARGSTFIRRPVIGIGPTLPINWPMAAVSCRLTATGCGIRCGDAMPGTATVARTRTTGSNSFLSIMESSTMLPARFWKPTTRAARLLLSCCAVSVSPKVTVRRSCSA